MSATPRQEPAARRTVSCLSSGSAAIRCLLWLELPSILSVTLAESPLAWPSLPGPMLRRGASDEPLPPRSVSLLQLREPWQTARIHRRPPRGTTRCRTRAGTPAAGNSRSEPTRFFLKAGGHGPRRRSTALAGSRLWVRGNAAAMSKPHILHM